MKQFETDRPIGGAYGVVMLLVVTPPEHITGRSLKALVAGGLTARAAIAYRQIYKQHTTDLRRRVNRERN